MKKLRFNVEVIIGDRYESTDSLSKNEVHDWLLNIQKQDIVDYISLLGAKTGTNVEVISGVAEHGIMMSNIGKIGAILRYNPNYTN